MRRLISIVGVTLLGSAAPAGQPVFRAGIDLVHFAIVVQDRKGNHVKDLTVDDFEVYEEGRKQTIRYFARGVGVDESALPLHLGLLFDTSGSMEKDLDFSRSAAIKFLNAIPQAGDMTLVDFDTEVRVARFSQDSFPRLVERIRGRKPDGWTALYDALGVYLDGAADQDGQKILVLYTDGGDTRSNLSFGDAMDLVRASDVTVYVIGFLQNQPSASRMDQRMRLQQIAEQTGGQAFFPMLIKEVDGVYDGIVAEIGARYSLGYSSTNEKTDGAWRNVEIRIKELRPELKGLRIRTRKGYFAPYKESPR